jgi:hypothetical protein
MIGCFFDFPLIRSFEEKLLEQLEVSLTFAEKNF